MSNRNNPKYNQGRRQYFTWIEGSGYEFSTFANLKSFERLLSFNRAV